MKLVTYRDNEGRARVGAVQDDHIVALPAVGSMLELIEVGPDAVTAARRALLEPADSIPLSGVKLLAPIPHTPKNIMCVGLNYLEHIEESQSASARPDVPVFFTKPPTAIAPPESEIPYPTATRELDYEVELAVVIGRRGKNIPRDEALDYVFGYTIINDITARDLQRKHGQWFKGKSLDLTCPMGPWIVTTDEIPDPGELDIISRVNGEVRQQSNTRHMIFDVAEIISSLSAGMTLEPGDVIATGTPSGVGMGFSPPRYLQVGDTVECEVQGIGVLRNTIGPRE